VCSGFRLLIAFDSHQGLWPQWTKAAVQLEASRLAREVYETPQLDGVYFACLLATRHLAWQQFLLSSWGFIKEVIGLAPSHC